MQTESLTEQILKNRRNNVLKLPSTSFIDAIYEAIKWIFSTHPPKENVENALKKLSELSVRPDLRRMLHEKARIAEDELKKKRNSLPAIASRNDLMSTMMPEHVAELLEELLKTGHESLYTLLWLNMTSAVIEHAKQHAPKSPLNQSIENLYGESLQTLIRHHTDKLTLARQQTIPRLTMWNAWRERILKSMPEKMHAHFPILTEMVGVDICTLRQFKRSPTTELATQLAPYREFLYADPAYMDALHKVFLP